jgi:hypothetical protein
MRAETNICVCGKLLQGICKKTVAAVLFVHQHATHQQTAPN